jgi:heptosyltransferase-2
MCKSNRQSEIPQQQSHIAEEKVLIWLPSPMGDAILCTPALRAIRERFKTNKITLLATDAVRSVLSPSRFNDDWLELKQDGPLATAKQLKEHDFTYAVLFKNSFASALAVYLAQIPARIGYARECRGLLLTEKLHPLKPPRRRFGHRQIHGHRSKFKPVSMVEYYLRIARWLGGKNPEKRLELQVDPQDEETLSDKLPQVLQSAGPVVIMVPGGAYGPSKCWSSSRFAQTAGRLINEYNATVVISVAPASIEKRIADDICSSSKHKLINLAKTPLSLGELKALFSRADLVISNDTGPRHIAIALGRKVVTLFGPNDPAWTDTDCENEIQIIGNVHCAPCGRPKCNKSEHLCMESITVQMVCEAAREQLENNRRHAVVLSQEEFVETEKSFFVNREYQAGLGEAGLTSTERVFCFDAAKNLNKSNLAGYRSRLRFEINYRDGAASTTVFMKRYDCPPVKVQLRNWLSHHSHRSEALHEYDAISKLTAAGIKTPKVVAYGEQRNALFETRSFIITEKIPDAEALERKLPACFEGPATAEKLRQRRDFIARSAAFVKKFHETHYRHRDLYLSHIFYSESGGFYLIDLARVFRPALLGKRFQIKDIAQVYYSAPGRYFSGTDRMRFYMHYAGRSRFRRKDKTFIRRVVKKAEQIARHDVRHGREVPFAS